MEKISDEQLNRELAFDQYGRYAVIRNIINTNRKGDEKFKVLDVGGEQNIMKKFLSEDEVFYLDPNVDSRDDNFIKADGCDMPLKDESFDWVVSADVFEHIPPEKREQFLKENDRVAKLGFILAAPFYSEEVQNAEINVDNSYKIINNGKGNNWLKEHIENGLPIEKNIENYIEFKKYGFQKISHNNVFLWEMLISSVLLAHHNLYDKVEKELEKLNYFYNSEIFPNDFNDPSYRKIYFVKKKKELKQIEISNKLFSNYLFLNVIKLNIDLINRVNECNKFVICQKDRNIISKDQAIHQKEAEIHKKEAEIEVMKSSKFWKLRKIYIILKRVALRLPPLALKGLKILVREGPREFINRFQKLLKSKNEEKVTTVFSEYDLERKYIDQELARNWKKLREKLINFEYQPLISVIMPVYNVEIKWLKKAIDSVLGQLYENWELCIIDDKSTDDRIKPFLEEYSKKDGRIKLNFLENNQHISGASNEALQMAEGEFVAFIDDDDEISPDALYEVVKALNGDKNIDVIYSDEDKVDEDGNFSEPTKKPDWNLDRLLTFNYTAHLSVYRKKIVDKVGGFRTGYEGAQDYDLMLRAVEHTKNIFHLKKTLYHWRKLPSSVAVNPDSKPYAYKAGKKALEDYLRRNDIKGTVTVPVIGKYKIIKNS